MTEIKPVAWTSKKGLRHLATMGFLSVGKHEDRERKIPLYGPEAADEITRLRQLLSEAQKREMEARATLQAMHRRAQTAEGAFRGVMNVIDLWEPTLKFHKLSTHDLVMRSIKQDFERAVKKASALQSEER